MAVNIDTVYQRVQAIANKEQRGYITPQEFNLLAKIFSESLPPMYPYEVEGNQPQIKQQDFDGRIDILPVSDPNIFSVSQRITLAQSQLQLAQSNPKAHNL